MNARQVFDGRIKILSKEELKNFGRQCYAIGIKIKGDFDYQKFKKIVNPITQNAIRSDNPQIRSIGGKLLQSFKKFR